jgi:phosphotransferase system enzyme I (PtsI)
MIVLQGNGVSAGIATGHAVKVDKGLPPVFKFRLRPEHLGRELTRLDDALAKTSAQLRRIGEVLEQELGREHSLMIEAQIMILQDAHFSGAIREIVRLEQVNSEWAIKMTMEKIQEVYAKLEDPYLREKIQDIEDIARRLLMNIAGRDPSENHSTYDDIILVSDEIAFSMFSDWNLKHLKGFTVDLGGWTSHTSIIARSLKIPAVIQLNEITQHVHTGDFLLVDGTEGKVYINPDPDTVERVHAARDLVVEASGPYCLLNGREPSPPVAVPDARLYVNTEIPVELADYRRLGVRGVGLFRSEYLFMGRPVEGITMSEHEAAYRDLANRVYPDGATIRTFDLGSDKMPELHQRFPEANPALGLRGIRLSLRLQEAFRRQLEGIVRANDRGNLRLTFPFVSALDEVQEARGILDEIRRSVGGDAPPLPVGAMLEIPSTMFIIGELAAEVDFFTLGTNDLVQYTLASNRDGYHGPSPYASAHPAVRKGLEMICREAAAHGREVVCCGEMASHPAFLLVLLGIGFRSFSVNVPSLGLVRYLLHHLEAEPLRRFYAELCSLTRLADIEYLFAQRLEEFFPAPFVQALQHPGHSAS